MLSLLLLLLSTPLLPLLKKQWVDSAGQAIAEEVAPATAEQAAPAAGQAAAEQATAPALPLPPVITPCPPPSSSTPVKNVRHQ